ncbi:MAG TPA: hypothetical protein VGM90_02790 [Kofleriaceae bacterium]
MTHLRTFAFALAATLTVVPACASSDDAVGDEDLSQDDSDATTVVSDDDLNGLWSGTLDGAALTDDVVVESWSAIGVRVHVGKDVYSMTRGGDTLTATQGTLAIAAHSSGVKDDTLTGTLAGHALKLKRDTTTKDSITLTFPGDRSFRQYLEDTIMPAASRDRESYKYFNKTPVGAFLKSCELYKHASWINKYMKGATISERYLNFSKIVSAVNGINSTPRRITKEYKFYNTISQNLKDPSLGGLAVSTFGMYFSTAAGGALRMPIASDSTAYFITDKPTRAELIGVVAMATPTHGPLASTFGRQLLDMGAMPAAETTTYARSMMELLAKSSNATASQLDGTGRSALTDWYAVMAIEDYRGMAFGFPTLGWGYNMTNVQFFGLVAHTLGNQVIVGNELRPGEASYADVLNNGNDMQEYSDMSKLKVLATNYIKAKHPELVTNLKAAFAGIVPDSALDYRAQADLFHYVAAQLYDSAGRSKNLKGAQADRAIEATVALISTLAAEKSQFETYILQQGYTKSATPAPASTGF